MHFLWCKTWDATISEVKSVHNASNNSNTICRWYWSTNKLYSSKERNMLKLLITTIINVLINVNLVIKLYKTVYKKLIIITNGEKTILLTFAWQNI